MNKVLHEGNYSLFQLVRPLLAMVRNYAEKVLDYTDVFESMCLRIQGNTRKLVS